MYFDMIVSFNCLIIWFFEMYVKQFSVFFIYFQVVIMLYLKNWRKYRVEVEVVVKFIDDELSLNSN